MVAVTRDEADPPRYNWTYVKHTIQALHREESGLKNVPTLLKRVLEDECWREYMLPNGGGRLVRFDDFAKFVTDEDGMNTTVDTLKRVCAADPEVLDLLDQALQGQHGGDRHSQSFKSHNITLEADTTEDPNQRGTSATGALRRLRKDAPELHQQVLAGELSAHAAAVKAGHRARTISVRPDDPDSLARTLRKHCNPDVLATLSRALQEPP